MHTFTHMMYVWSKCVQVHTRTHACRLWVRAVFVERVMGQWLGWDCLLALRWTKILMVPITTAGSTNIWVTLQRSNLLLYLVGGPRISTFEKARLSIEMPDLYICIMTIKILKDKDKMIWVLTVCFKVWNPSEIYNEWQCFSNIFKSNFFQFHYLLWAF